MAAHWRRFRCYCDPGILSAEAVPYHCMFLMRAHKVNKQSRGAV